MLSFAHYAALSERYGQIPPEQQSRRLEIFKVLFIPFQEYRRNQKWRYHAKYKTACARVCLHGLPMRLMLTAWANTSKAKSYIGKAHPLPYTHDKIGVPLMMPVLWAALVREVCVFRLRVSQPVHSFDSLGYFHPEYTTWQLFRTKWLNISKIMLAEPTTITILAVPYWLFNNYFQETLANAVPIFFERD